MAIADAQLVIGVDHVDGLLDGVRQFGNAGDAFRPEHALGDLLQVLGRHHAVAPRVLRDDHLAEQRLQHAEILLDLLVGHHGDHAHQLLEIVILLDRGAQRFRRVHIVPAVEDDGRRRADLFDAPGDLHGAQRLGDDVAVQRAVDRNHHFRRAQGCERVMRLMLAELGDRHFGVCAVRGAQGGHLAAYRGHTGDDFGFDAVAHQVGVVLLGRGLDDRHDLFLVGLATDDGGASGLDDAGLLGGDLFDGVAQPCHVVHIDRPDDRGVGVEHVGGVPAAAHADLHDGHVDRSVGEFPDGHGGEHFEEAHLRLAELVHLHIDDGDQILDLVPGVDEIVIGKLLAVDGDALVDVLQMRRGVQAGAHAVGTADGLRHAGGGPLAVGAGDVDHAERLLRMPHDVENHLHTTQVEVRGVALRRTAHDVALDVDHAFVVAIRMLE